MVKSFFKRRSAKILTALALTLCIGAPANVSASSNDVVQVEKEVVANYLNAIKNSDFDKAVELAKDSGVSTEEYKLNLKEMVSNPNNEIRSFEILDKFDKQENNTTLYVRLEYLNGDVEECPVRLEKYNGEYIIVRTDAETTEIKKGIQIPVKQLRTQLVKWDLSTDRAAGRSNAYSSSFTTGASYVQLNYQSGGGNAFRIVKYGYFGDTDISYAANVSYTSGTPQQVRLNIIPGKSFDNVKLRITENDGGNRTFGEIYAY